MKLLVTLFLGRSESLRRTDKEIILLLKSVRMH